MPTLIGSFLRMKGFESTKKDWAPSELNVKMKSIRAAHSRGPPENHLIRDLSGVILRFTSLFVGEGEMERS
jgi:hypothetical protein